VGLWRRNNITKWKFLSFLDEKNLRSFCMAADGEHITVLMDKANEGLLLRAYDDTLGWSEFKKIDNGSEFASNNAIASLGEKRYIAAYCGKQGILILSLGKINFHEEP
jgi:hypothetical protein